jgi:peptidoglycan/xylan/chitin deacetylase (PgdA/CDA1 family)
VKPILTTHRKILCALASAALALAACAPIASAAPAVHGGPKIEVERIAAAKLTQAGRDLIFSVRTASPVAVSRLSAHPDPGRPASRYLCLAMSRGKGQGETRLCLGGKHSRKRVGSEVVNAAGRVKKKGSVAATVKRSAAGKFTVSLLPEEAGLTPHGYAWRVLASPGCAARQRCAVSLPAKGAFSYRLRPVRAVGCTGGTAGLDTNGSRDEKVVALTFDDGPSDYTDGFLKVLREEDVHGTFFEIGQEMSGRESTMRKILAEGNEIGDHTMNHVELPGYDQIAGAAHLIQQYTHFKPCLFRPPGGAVDSSVIATAGSLGMRTINWDVDPRDWSTPGTSAIYDTIVSHAQSGSIILMHDGGGPRGETLEALPHVIDTLRSRGYDFETVTELLGHRMLYQPYG